MVIKTTISIGQILLTQFGYLNFPKSQYSISHSLPQMVSQNTQTSLNLDFKFDKPRRHGHDFPWTLTNSTKVIRTLPGHTDIGRKLVHNLAKSILGRVPTSHEFLNPSKIQLNCTTNTIENFHHYPFYQHHHSPAPANIWTTEYTTPQLLQPPSQLSVIHRQRQQGSNTIDHY